MGGKLLVSVVLVVALAGSTSAFCPSQCQCNDHALEAVCSGSRLDVVPILLNPSLRSLRLANNRISTIRQSLGFYTDLELLDLSHNALTGLDQRQLESQKVLRQLNVSHNGILQLEVHSFHGLKQLQVLDLSHNELTVIQDGPLSVLDQLVELDLSYNRIERLSDACFVSLTRLRSLSLRGNRLQQLAASSPSWASLGASLVRLDLSHNQLAQLDAGSDEGSVGLSALMELRQLNLSNNTLHHIHYAAFDGLRSLAELDLSANRLEYVPSDALAAVGATLRLLDLSSNYMSQINADAFSELAILETLRVADVFTLTAVHGDALAALNGTLQTLVLSNNRHWSVLEPQLLSSLSSLRYVDLSGSGLQTVAEIERWPPQLEHLDLSGNPLECNCSMHWLWQHQHNLQETARAAGSFAVPMKDIVCRGPPQLAGQHFFQLEESVLVCWNTTLILAAAFVGAAAFVILGAGLAVLCCWRRRGLHKKHASTSSTSSASSTSSHPPPILHPHLGVGHHLHSDYSIKQHLANTMLHHHAAGNHPSYYHTHEYAPTPQVHHHVYQSPDSPPLKSKTLSLPKTVDYFLNEDDYVYHPAGQINNKPIPVTAV